MSAKAAIGPVLIALNTRFTICLAEQYKGRYTELRPGLGDGPEKRKLGLAGEGIPAPGIRRVVNRKTT